MREKIYVDRLFAGYDDTQELRDFKEEITVNLRERVKELAVTGMAEDEAFEKASAELGDITAVADTAARQKRTETIGQMYVKAKVPLTKRTALGVAIASALVLLAGGLVLGGILNGGEHLSYFTQPFYAASLVLAIAGGLFVFFGLTQETAAHYAMRAGRAGAYAIICLVGVLALGLLAVSFCLETWQLSTPVVYLKAALLLPVIGGLVFLLATEPKRQKQWLKSLIEREFESGLSDLGYGLTGHRLVDPVRAVRFGILSGTLWLLAIALFVVLGVFIAWQVSWLPLLFALPVQVFMAVFLFKDVPDKHQ
ncbi:MAG: permease prefix domain 1-containing protein [Coriobacteriaceae bacterium]|jgi:hypothetical protein|nr:permease prefix domain 1-containing protein [Coriobacteriaceae bacterium]